MRRCGFIRRRDERGIHRGDFLRELGPPGRDAALLHLDHRAAQMDLRQAVDALRFEAAVIDARPFSRQLKRAVDVIGPQRAPLLETRRLVPCPHLGAEALALDRAQRQQDVRVMVPLVAVRRMQRDVGHHAVIDKGGAHEAMHQVAPRGVGQLMRQGQFDIAGKLRVLALLGGLDAVPQPRPLAHPCRCVLRGKDRRIQYATAAAVVEGEPGALVEDQFACPVGRCRRHRAPGGAPHDVSR